MRYFSCRSSRRRLLPIALAVVALVLAFAAFSPGGAAPALATAITTPYLGMTVQAGQTVTIGLTVEDTVAQRVDLAVEGVPSAWEATILGGGRPVSAIMTDPNNPRDLDLQVVIPADAAEGISNVKIVGRSAAESTTLAIALKVSKVEGGTTALTAEYDSLRGPAKATFTYSLTLKNNTLEARTYNLSATGPDGWILSLKPSGASQETPTVTVESQGQQRLDLTVTPPPGIGIGTYDLVVAAAGGGETVSVPLQVEITGTYTLTLTTPDGNLNAAVKAGSTTRVQFVVTNSGTGPLHGVELSAAAPANWEVTFEPKVIAELPANEQLPVTAVFMPAENAIAGDYVVTMHAQADQASAQSDIRVTVKTSTLWGVIGILIAVAAIAILGFVFRRYGHR